MTKIRLNREWDTETKLFHYRLRDAGYPLDGIYMGRSLADARQSLVMMNKRREQHGFEPFEEIKGYSR